MSRKNYQHDPIVTAKRKNVTARRVGLGKECACGENRPKALIPRSKPTICEKCKRLSDGRCTDDAHHVAGKSNHPLTMPVPVNDHVARLSESQYEWPQVTRENPDSSPLLAIAGCIRGFYDTIVYLLDRLLLWAAEFVENLDAFLTFHFGRKWWLLPEVAQFIGWSS